MTETESRLGARVRAGEPILVVELTPPATGDGGPLRASARRYAGKVAAIGVSDNRHGIAMSSLAAAALVAGEGVEPILHLVTRDRNRAALVSSCLGAHALGIRNILCTSGTHQTLGVCKPAKSVYDIDAVQLLDTVARLNGGGFCLGAVAAPYADPAELQLMRLAKKVRAGARFLVTQPVYDVERFKAWWSTVTAKGLETQAAFLAGIDPLLDAETAKDVAGSRPNPVIPGSLLDRLAGAGDKAAQRAAGIAVAVETIRQLKELPGLRGFQICADQDDEAVLEIIETAGVK